MKREVGRAKEKGSGNEIRARSSQVVVLGAKASGLLSVVPTRGNRKKSSEHLNLSSFSF
jgi:hypothetical protein